MGKINDMKDFLSGKDKKQEKDAEKAAKKSKTVAKLKKIAMNSIIGSSIKLIMSISIFTLIGASVTAVITSVIDIFTAKNTPEKIYEAFDLENQDFSDLVEIKGDETSRLLFTI